MSKKSQSSVEFLLVFSLLAVFVTLFLGLIYSNTYQARVKDDQEVADDMANFVQQEFVLASKVEDGYNRTFFLPEKISGKKYNITMSDNHFVINTSKVISTKGIPKVNVVYGFNMAGNNSIFKNELGIRLN